MKFSAIFLSGLIILLSFISLIAETRVYHGVYYAELEALKEDPETKLIFNEDAHQSLSEIQRDIITYKNLTNFQRFVRFTFFALDVVVVTPETMPLLYEYVDSVCKKAKIATPTIFVTRKDGFFNAAAQKLLMSTGGIVIGQKLINELSDEALEGVIAHEIGHIKHNHINKMLGLFVLQIIACIQLCKILQIKSGIIPGDVPEQTIFKSYVYYGKITCLMNLLSCVAALFINKRFEKEADEFAYKVNGKGEGLIEFFELLLRKDELKEQEFIMIYKLLQENKPNLAFGDYYELLGRYYLAKAGQAFTNFYKQIYYETFIGAHPSPQARIAAAKKYLAGQQQA